MLKKIGAATAVLALGVGLGTWQAQASQAPAAAPAPAQASSFEIPCRFASKSTRWSATCIAWLNQLNNSVIIVQPLWIPREPLAAGTSISEAPVGNARAELRG